MTQFHVGVCIPSRDNWKADFGQSLAMAIAATWRCLPEGWSGGITTYNKTNCSVLHQGRNGLVVQALLAGCTHILFLDDDMRFPMETIARMLMWDKDILAANCTTKEIPARTTAIDLDGQAMCTRADSEGIEKCRSVGTGVMMIKAAVFKALDMPWFDYEWIDTPRKFDPAKSEKENMLNYWGEDRFFCNKARAAGYDIWVDHELSKPVCHMGDWPYGHTFVPGYRGEEGLREEDILRTGT